MLKKIEKLESTVNQKLEAFIALFMRLIHWMLPVRVFQWVDDFKQRCLDLWQDIKNKLILFGLKIWEIILNIWGKILDFKNNFQSIKDNFFSQIDDKIQATVKYLQTTSFKAILLFIIEHGKPWIKNMTAKAKKVSSNQSSIAIFAMLMILGGIYGIYHSTQQIYKKEYVSGRTPANVQEYDYKPDYKLYPRQTSHFYNIKVPLMVQRVGNVDSVTIDFSVRTSTRFAKIYLEEYDYKLKDYFFTSVQPIASDFPLKEEGKEVLKDKIKREVDRFLKENNVEGHVEEVRILFIVGS